MPDGCGTCPFGHGKLWALAAGKKKNCAACKDLEKATANTIKAKQEYDAYNPDVYEKTFSTPKQVGMW